MYKHEPINAQALFPGFFNRHKKEELKDQPLSTLKANIVSAFDLKEDQIHSVALTEKDEIRISFNKEIDDEFVYRLRVDVDNDKINIMVYSSSEDLIFTQWNPDILPFITIPSEDKERFIEMVDTMLQQSNQPK